MARANIDSGSYPSKEWRTDSSFDIDAAVRSAAFNFLDQQTLMHGEVVPRSVLARGFDFDGRRVPLPLVYLWGVVPGQYMPVWPVFVVQDDRDRLTFSVAVDDAGLALPSQIANEEGVAELRRAYVTTLSLRRLHQQRFRLRVLRAYRESCAVCSLRHGELLEASHILPDGHPLGEPSVRNGIALCKLHHAAYDRNILGIGPDLRVSIRTDILQEVDGPMLRHGLQGFEGSRIRVPSVESMRPAPEFLAERFLIFRRAS
jgi:putative restriction endonuclease